MPNLSLYLSGSFKATLDQEMISGFESNKVRALFAYLAVESAHAHSRDALAGLFWPEQPDQTARKNLRQALSNLRKTIQDATAAVPYLHVWRDTVRFNINSDHWVDVAEFITLLDTCEEHHHRHLDTCNLCAQRLQRAVDLYRGDFLAGFYLKDSIAFQDWILLTRERYHRRAVRALSVLSQYYESRANFKAARRCAHRQVALDPWREEAHQQLIRLLALGGERSAALKQYETCRRVLADELGIEPSRETIRLYEQIKSDSLKPPAPPRELSNLPVHLTPFVGREAELEVLFDHLRDPDCRLLTLVGPGGIGKTRLALQVATEEIYNFSQGVYLVPLAAVDSSQALPYAIAEVLNFTFQGREDPGSQLIDYLHSKETLLLLDNFEHLLDDVSLIVKILRRAPGVVLLVTSREALGLQAERLFDVQGLPYPKEDSCANVEQYDAVQLFLERARRVQADFLPNMETVFCVTRICQLVEGLPLAIELAAVWTRSFSCDHIGREIERSLDFLATSMRDLPDRHRSLRAAFEYSWKLLTNQEQDVFCKLSIFRGSFLADAAEQIAGASQSVLVALVEKSLLRRDSFGRYDLHELLRQYAAEKLKEVPGEQEKTKNLHCAYYAAFLKQRESALFGTAQQITLDEIRDEIQDVRAAWKWAVASLKMKQINHCLESLYQFYRSRSWVQEGEESFNILVMKLDESRGQLEKQDSSESRYHPLLLGKALARRGWFLLRLSSYEQARDCFEESKAIFTQLGERDELAFVLNDIGYMACLLGEYGEAKSLCQKSLAICQETGNQQGAASALANLGFVADSLGNYKEAKHLYQDSLTIIKRIGIPRAKATVLSHLGLTVHVLEDYVEARQLHQESLKIRQMVDDQWGIASSFNNLGSVAWALEQYDEARRLYKKGYLIFKDIGDQLAIANSRTNLSYIDCAQGKFRESRKGFLEALTVAMELQAAPGAFQFWGEDVGKYAHLW